MSISPTSMVVTERAECTPGRRTGAWDIETNRGLATDYKNLDAKPRIRDGTRFDAARLGKEGGEMPETWLNRGLTVGDQAFTDAGGDIQCLSGAVKIVAVVGNAQARIDNGGFRYFLETDWVGNPPYSVFSDALRSIGATANADAIDAAVAELGFGHPERDVERRLRVLAGPKGARIESMERDYVDDVWQLLGEFIIQHKRALFPRSTSASLQRTKRRKR